MSDTQLIKRAAATVAEMIELGAHFTISDGGTRWTWTPRPEPMRGVIRRYWQCLPDRCAPGFPEAMLSAVRRHVDGGARVR